MKRRLSLKRIQLLGVGALVALIAMVGVGALYSAAGIEKIFSVSAELNQKVQSVDSLLLNFISVRREFATFVIEEQENVRPVLKKVTSLQKKAVTFVAELQDRTEKSIAEKLLSNLKKYRASMIAYSQELSMRRTGEGVRTWEATLLDLEQKTHENGIELKQHIQNKIDANQQKILAESAYFKRMGIIATLGGILISVVVMLLLRAAINRPVKAILSAAQSVTKGDLSSEIGDESDDNFGVISRAIDEMNLSLRTSVGGLRHISGDVRDVSRDIEKYSLDVVRGAGQQLDGVEEVSTGVEKMNSCADETSHRLNDLIQNLQKTTDSTMEMASAISDVSSFVNYTEKEVAEITESQMKVVAGLDGLVEVFSGITSSAHEMEAASDRLTESSQEVGETAKNSIKLADAVVRLATDEGGTAVTSLISISQRNMELAEHYAAIVQSLGEKSKSVGRILEVIREVADNAALLSLNAAIISAQAGEHGRSFSVVADEIRTLARSTTSNVEEIETVIDSVITEVDRAVTLIDELTDGASQSVNSAEQAKTFLGTIAEHSSRSADMAREISTKTKDQVDRSRLIRQEITGNVANVERVNAMVQEQKGNSTLIVESTSKLKEIAKTLSEGSSRLDDSSASISRVIVETQIFAKKTEAVIEEERKVSAAILESVYRIAEVTDGNMNLMQWMGVAVTRLKDLVERLLPEVDHFQIRDEDMQEYYPGQVSSSSSEQQTPDEEHDLLSELILNEKLETSQDIDT